MAEVIPGAVKLPWFFDGRTYVIEVEFALVTSRLECVGFRVRSYSDEDDADTLTIWALHDTPLPEPVTDLPPAVSATMMREVPVGNFIRQARASLMARSQRAVRLTETLEAASGQDLNERERARKDQSARAAGAVPKGRRYGPEDYARVAEVYSEAEAEGRPPTKAVAAEFFISKGAAAKLVARVRNEMGLLPKTERGRSRGKGLELTEEP